MKRFLAKLRIKTKTGRFVIPIKIKAAEYREAKYKAFSRNANMYNIDSLIEVKTFKDAWQFLKR